MGDFQLFLEGILNNLGFGASGIYWLFGIGLVLFVIASRELLTWYLKINKILDEIETQKNRLKEIDAEMEALSYKIRIQKLRPVNSFDEAPDRTATEKIEDPSQFPLSH